MAIRSLYGRGAANVFYRVAVSYQIERVGKDLENRISQGPLKHEDSKSALIKLLHRFDLLDYYRGVSELAKRLLGLRWSPELKPLADEIEKYAAYVEEIVSAAEKPDLSIQVASLASDLNPTLSYLGDCIEAYIDPLELDIDRGSGLAPKGAAREGYSRRDSTREFVRDAQWAIEERRGELEETIGSVLEAYHWQRKYEGYRRSQKYLPLYRRALLPRRQPLFSPRIDDPEAKLEIVSCAGRYLDRSWMHCRSATDLILLAVLDTEFVPLDRKVQAAKRFIVTDTLPRLVYLAVAIAWIGYAFAVGKRIAWGGIVFAAWVIFAPFFVRERERRSAKLESIRTEVATTAYDADGIASRLERAEESGLVVPTIAYSLLKLRAQQQSH